LKCGDLHRRASRGTGLAAGAARTFVKGEHMRVRHLAVSITAAAVMGAFGPAFAQTSSTDQSAQPSQPSTSQPSRPNGSTAPSVGVDANAGISNSDVNAGVSANQSAQQSQSSGSGSSSGTSPSASGSTSSAPSASGSPPATSE